jgi:hypothetical protein
MASASRDDNRVPVILGVLNTDGSTPTAINSIATFHSLSVSNGTSGSDAGGGSAQHDNNRVPTLIAVSNSDGVTPVAVYVTSGGALLIQDT